MLSAHAEWTLCVHKGRIVWGMEAGLVLLLLDYISLQKGGSHGRGEGQSPLSLDCSPMETSIMATHEVETRDDTSKYLQRRVVKKCTSGWGGR